MCDKKLLSLLFAILCLPLLAKQQPAQTTLLVAFGADKPPFVLSDRETISGLEVDIFREAMAGSGYQLELVALPFHQLNRALLLFPDLDVAAGVGTEFFDKLHYVDQFSYYENVAISKAAANVKLGSIRDLQQHSVVSWQGASQPATPLGSVFHHLFGATERPIHQGYQELSQYNQNAMFWLERTDVIVVDRAIFSWYRRMLADSYNTTAEIIIHELFPERQYTRVAFRDPELAALFAAGLEQLKASGRYQQLYQHYLD